MSRFIFWEDSPALVWRADRRRRPRRPWGDQVVTCERRVLGWEWESGGSGDGEK